MLHAESIPALADAEQRWSMIVLHGLGDSLEGYRWLPELLRLPWLTYVLVNAPDPYFGGYSWYDFDGNPDAGVRRSRALLIELLEKRQRSGWIPERQFLFGFSQGGLMTLDTGLRYPRSLAGLIAVSGYVHEPASLLRERSPAAARVPVLVTHGTRDPMIPIEPVRHQIDGLREAGVPIRWHEFPKEHTIAGEQELSVIRRFVEEVRAGAPVPGQSP